MISESLKINTTLTELYLGSDEIEVKWKQKIMKKIQKKDIINKMNGIIERKRIEK